MIRRSGSSSCILKPRAALSNEDIQNKSPLSVTMVNNTALPTYSTERYYMLSEIELNGHSTLFLCDYSCDQTPDTVPESDTSEGEHPFPAHLLLYILWKPDMVCSPKALAKGVIRDALNQLKSLTDSRDPKIYLVVDSLSTETDAQDDLTRQRIYDSQVRTVGELARCVAQSTELRDELEGFTIGVSNHMRAAPGLEKCMEAMCWGSKDRRKVEGGKSSVGIVTQHPDDLIGLQEDPDAAQGVLQSITCAEWNGNGDLASFAKRAHVVWCANNGAVLEEGQQPRPKVMPRRIRRMDMNDGIVADPLTIFLFVCIASWLYLHISTSYEDGLRGFMDRLESLLAREEKGEATTDEQL
jgi:hypothetical protein